MVRAVGHVLNKTDKHGVTTPNDDAYVVSSCPTEDCNRSVIHDKTLRIVSSITIRGLLVVCVVLLLLLCKFNHGSGSSNEDGTVVDLCSSLIL